MTGGYIGAVSIEGGGLRMPSMVVFCDVKGVRDADQSKLAPKSSVAAYKRARAGTLALRSHENEPSAFTARTMQNSPSFCILSISIRKFFTNGKSATWDLGMPCN